MSQTRTTDPIGHLELVEQARQAYEQKRTKDCLDLTRAILLIDPDNADAYFMRSSIQSEMQRDLENASAFIRQARARESVEVPSQPSRAEVPAVVEPIVTVSLSRRTAGTRSLMHASVLVLLSIVVAGLLPRFIAQSTPAKAPEPIVHVMAAQPEPLPLPQPEESAPALMEALPATPPALPVKLQAPPAPAPVLQIADAPVVPVINGTLAVSSPAAVDIYKDDAYLGSAPISLELPAGMHTLEYRHGSLRRNVTHLISGNETTRAMIAFEVSVQVNSRPWAEVFLDGVEKTALGQTPLSGMRVPIGSVLIFENPQFQTKKYRVTGSERIQNVFP